MTCMENTGYIKEQVLQASGICGKEAWYVAKTDFKRQNSWKDNAVLEKSCPPVWPSKTTTVMKVGVFNKTGFFLCLLTLSFSHPVTSLSFAMFLFNPLANNLHAIFSLKIVLSAHSIELKKNKQKHIGKR